MYSYWFIQHVYMQSLLCARFCIKHYRGWVKSSTHNVLSVIILLSRLSFIPKTHTTVGDVHKKTQRSFVSEWLRAKETVLRREDRTRDWRFPPTIKR